MNFYDRGALKTDISRRGIFTRRPEVLLKSKSKNSRFARSNLILIVRAARSIRNADLSNQLREKNLKKNFFFLSCHPCFSTCHFLPFEFHYRLIHYVVRTWIFKVCNIFFLVNAPSLSIQIALLRREKILGVFLPSFLPSFSSHHHHMRASVCVFVWSIIIRDASCDFLEPSGKNCYENGYKNF